MSDQRGGNCALPCAIGTGSDLVGKQGRRGMPKEGQKGVSLEEGNGPLSGPTRPPHQASGESKVESNVRERADLTLGALE